ncbi:helix-turn-helix domain-containing protein [Conexibacter stalactiti]|uniref:Helix-turn-helix domain-containing protein n=1 Tax=Conexibacter stalactiti TaxID=1940611 RepID=A0ABU4HS74_9ACTN|nr:helix-turn-helix domain-containing protein [Conexibacter stalactiti]MDW5596163.1 helix-turn-helix domain-containing protein [Conexibacter stalactiti]MEC5036805.1 helix-turn-helix domain-containing protein [Conexibacter stalactiti]
MAAGTPHHVVALVSEGVIVLDLAAPAHLFGFVDPARYSFALAAERPGAVMSSSGFAIVAEHGLDELARADTIVVPGSVGAEETTPAPALLDVLRAAAERGARIVSVCAGAFALAHAGLLDGRRATTHWADADLLATRFPRVTVDPDVLYVDEGQVLTSAGIAAGLDLCLHVVRRDHGAEVAADFARRTVIAPHRDGGQAQFIEAPVTTVEEVASVALDTTRAWALERLHEPLPVERLAAHAHVSPRTFARRFRAETGTTPAQWLLHQRVLAARRLLEGTDAPVEQVAADCGFGSAASLRTHFARATRTSPTAYRRAFRTG